MEWSQHRVYAAQTGRSQSDLWSEVICSIVQKCLGSTLDAFHSDQSQSAIREAYDWSQIVSAAARTAKTQTDLSSETRRTRESCNRRGAGGRFYKKQQNWEQRDQGHSRCILVKWCEGKQQSLTCLGLYLYLLWSFWIDKWQIYFLYVWVSKTFSQCCEWERVKCGLKCIWVLFRYEMTREQEQAQYPWTDMLLYFAGQLYNIKKKVIRLNYSVGLFCFRLFVKAFLSIALRKDVTRQHFCLWSNGVIKQSLGSMRWGGFAKKRRIAAIVSCESKQVEWKYILILFR